MTILITGNAGQYFHSYAVLQEWLLENIELRFGVTILSPFVSKSHTIASNVAYVLNVEFESPTTDEIDFKTIDMIIVMESQEEVIVIPSEEAEKIFTLDSSIW
jgi:hypothetical protein